MAQSVRTYLQCRRPGLIPGSRRSPGEGNGNTLQYFGLENPRDRGAWWAKVHGFTTKEVGGGGQGERKKERMRI